MSVEDEKPSAQSVSLAEADSSDSTLNGNRPNRSTGETSSKKGETGPYLTTLKFAFLFIFVASGWVPWEDVFFSIFASLYIYVMSRMVFPPVSSTSAPGMVSGSRVFRYYLLFAALIGLVLPFVYTIVGAFLEGDQTAVRVGTAHLFLLYCQVLSENYATPSISLPVRALVPILYNSRRLFTLWIWVGAAFSKDTGSLSLTWVLFERFLAVSNILFWNYNLWAFLLPVYLPWALLKYYEAHPTIREKLG